MIKIFGKIRYHWQPELSWSIIYWSIAIAPIFIALSFLYERASIPHYFFFLFTLFIVLVGAGFHRYFVIEENGILRVVSLSPFKPSKIVIADIEKVIVTKSTLTLVVKGKKDSLFYMRKWPKKYFLDALALAPDFRGEVELIDNFIDLDYFEAYKQDKKALTAE
ncbi:EbsA family protein [Streptococcus ferus]|uniref:Membrane protein n=1 Tax=Streptococcus ferus TaxID=1345 RepID=A0A2X3W9X2_9STRE|nr:EbsA family protein [Streptococcus ferus]SQF40653.1 membrane protein [Streptococcus ferus]